MSKNETSKVRVVCRVRPQNAKEVNSGGYICVRLSSTAIECKSDEGVYNFSFDRVFGPESTQIEVFQYTAIPMINDVLTGYNATIFAYGQTSSGKTFTMEGPDIRDETYKGIIPRTVEALFAGVSEADEVIEFTFKVSYVEIYMEKIRDLLDVHRVKTNLAVREDKLKGIYIAGVTEEYVTSQEELLNYMAAGAENRATAATGMNEGSSRSHSVFTITVQQRDVTNATSKTGKLVLVDLAGSEMVRKTNATGQQLEEAKTINKSLSALGQVIMALTDEKATHIPYRDSKLTRILQDSLGGNSKTVLIVACSPHSFNANETISTLRFGTRAKTIENKVTVNQVRSVEELEELLARAERAIDAQQAHIMSLAAALAARGPDDGESGGGGGDPGLISQLQQAITNLQQQLEDEREENTRIRGEYDILSNVVNEKEVNLQEAMDLLMESEKQYNLQKDRADNLQNALSSAGEMEDLKSDMKAQMDKLLFDLEEMKTTKERLETENERMTKELAELSGEGTSEGHVRREGRNVVDTGSAMDMEEAVTSLPPPPPASTTAAESSDSSGSTSKDVTYESLKLEGRAAAQDEARLQLLAMLQRLGIAGGDIAQNINGWAEGLIAEQERWFKKAEEKFADHDRATVESGKKLREMEVQRSRLEKDLTFRTEKYMQLQSDFEKLQSLDTQQALEFLAERERAHMKSLQQRLEQLVAVHRQLLRKFASLELENGELKKKISLRDERIRQLEHNSRAVTGQMRNQAEKHISELTNLRDQIQSLRLEHQQKLDSKAQDFHKHDGPRTVRGGHHVEQPRSLRGGGGTKPVASPPEIKTQQSTLFSRLLGPKG